MKKIWLDSWSIWFITLDDTKLSEFGWGEYSALLRFAHSGNEFLYGKIVWSAFHGRFKSKYLQLQKPYNNSTDGIV